jgi:hypothetical protein
VRHSFDSEVVEANRLFLITATPDSLDEHLFSKVIIVETATDRLPVLLFSLCLKGGLEFLIVDTLTRFIPPGVYVLHVAIEATELRQKLGLVEILVAVLHIRLDAWLSIKTTVCIVFCLVNGLAEQMVVPSPLFKLLNDLIVFSFVRVGEVC